MRNLVARRVAVVGGIRIPFCRANTAYSRCSNQDMMTAVLSALVDRYSLKGERLGDVSLGAVIKHSRDWILARESTLSSGLAAETPAFDHPARLRNELVGVDLDRQQDFDRYHRGWNRGRHRHISQMPIVYPDAYAQLLLESARGRSFGQRLKPWLRLRPRHLKPVLPGVIEPRTNLSMGESMEITAKEWQLTRARAGRARAREPPERRQGVRGRFLRGLGGPVSGRRARQQPARRHEPRAAREAEARVRPRPERHAHRRQQHAVDGRRLRRAARSEHWAAEHALPISAYLTYAREAAVDFVHGEGLLMAPAYAVSAMLTDAQLESPGFRFLRDSRGFRGADARDAEGLGVGEVLPREAWPRQCDGIDRSREAQRQGRQRRDRPSVRGHGHAARRTLAKLLHERGRGRGLISVCTAGGMGVTAILEAA